MDQKQIKNGLKKPKMDQKEQKWTKNETKMDQKRIKNGLKTNQKRIKNGPKTDQK